MFVQAWSSLNVVVKSKFWFILSFLNVINHMFNILYKRGTGKYYALRPEHVYQ